MDQLPSADSPAAPSAPKTPQRRLWWLLGGGLALALVVGLTVALWPGGSRQMRAPFDQAVANLASAQAIHQKASLGGLGEWDVQVTKHGEATGSMTVAGLSLQMLIVGGKTYVKPPQGLLPGGTSNNLPASVLKGRWVEANGSLLDESAGQIGTPASIADKLHGALAGSTRFPSSTHPTDTVAGTPAIKASTSTGDLYITASTPYQVLRFAPRAPRGNPLSNLPSLPSVPTSLTGMPSLTGIPSLPALPSLSLPGHNFVQLPAVAPAPTAALSMDISSETIAEVEQTYSEIKDEVGQLQHVVEAGVDAEPLGPAQLDCGPAGCQVSANVEVTSRAGAKVQGELSMEAVVTVNGEPAGSCAAPAMPITGGAVELSCDDPAAAAAYEQQIAQASEAGGQVLMNWEAEVHAFGEAQVNVEQQVAQIEQELQQAEQEMQQAAGGGGGGGAPPPVSEPPPGAPSSEPSSSNESSGAPASQSAVNDGLGELVPVNAKDPSADALARRIGGEPSRKFANDPSGREFDAVSDKYLAQAKPANFTLNKKFRDQAKATFEDAKRTGRIPYFQFDGPPGPGVLDALNRYAERYGLQPVIDLKPLS